MGKWKVPGGATEPSQLMHLPHSCAHHMPPALPAVAHEVGHWREAKRVGTEMWVSYLQALATISCMLDESLLQLAR